MAVNITTLAIEVKSIGIDEASEKLNSNADASSRAEKAAKSYEKSQADSAASIEKLMTSFQKQADLLGANTSQMFSYAAAMKGATDLEKTMAAMLGAEVDAYKALSTAQSEALATNKAMQAAQEAGNKLNMAGQRAAEIEKENARIREQVVGMKEIEREIAQEIKQQMQLNDIQSQARSLNMAGQRAADYKKEMDAQRELNRAHSEAITIDKQLSAEIERTKNSNDKWLASLTDTTNRLKMTREEYSAYKIGLIEAEAAQRGMTSQAAGHIASLKETGIAAQGAHSGMAGMTRESIVLIHELSQGQFKRFGGSLLVMAEYFDFSKTVLAGLNATMAAFSVGMVGALTIIASGIAVIVAFGVALAAVYEDREKLREMNVALLMTGNAAGTTGAQMMDMAHAATQSSGSLSAAKDVILDLAKTGKYTAEQMDYITKAVVGLEHSAGVPIEETMKAFAKLSETVNDTTVSSSRAISNHAAEVNKQYHFLSITTFNRIMELEKEGNAVAAQELVLKSFSQSLEERTLEAEALLTNSQKQIKSYIHSVQEAWAALTNTESTAVKRGKMVENIKNVESRYLPSEVEAGRKKEIAALAKFDADILSNQQKAEAERAFAQKTAAQVASQQRIGAINEQRSGVSGAQKAYDSYLTDLANSSEEYRRNNAEQIAKKSVEMEKATHEKIKKVRGEGTSGVNLGIANLEKEASSEQDVYNSRLKMIDLYHKGAMMSDADAANAKISVYKDMVASTDSILSQEIEILKKFHGKDLAEQNAANTKMAGLVAAKSKLMSEANTAMSAEELKNLGKSKLALDAEQKQSDKTVEAIQKKVQELKFMNDAYNKLPEAIKKAGITEKAMQDAITQQRIEFLQSEIDNASKSEDLSNELTQIKIANWERERDANKLLMTEQRTREDQFALNKKNTEITQAEKELSVAHLMEKTYKDAYKGMEDAMVSFITNGKMNFKSFADSIISELIRIQVRQAIGSASGSGSGLIGLAMSAFGAIAGAGSPAVAGATSAGITAGAGLGLGGESISAWVPGHAMGGYNPSGSVGQVGEGNRPELFTSGGKQYLIAGDQGGEVKPMSEGAGSTQVTYSPVIHIDSRTDRAEVAQLVQKAVQSGNAQLMDKLSRSGQLR